MGINELFDGIAKVVERFAEEIAEQRLREKCREPNEVRKGDLRKQRKKLLPEKRAKGNFPKRE